MLKHSLAAASATFICLVGAMAQNTPDKGRQIIDRAITALGGDRFLNLKNVVSSGRGYGFFHDELSGLDLQKSVIEYLPDATKGLHARQRVLIGKKQDYSVLYLPDAGYELTFRGVRQVPDEQWAKYERSTRNNFIYIARTRLKEPGLQFDYVSSEIYLSRHVEIIEITDSTDQVVRVYFDHNSGLPVHETYNWFDPAMKAHNDEAIEFDKYRDAGGVMWPFSIERESNGYKVSQFFADKVEVNQALAPSFFDLPSSLKRLKKSN
jgi:hypothetical protein